jgi:hypothetical protein
MDKQTLVTIGWLAIAMFAAPLTTADASDSRKPPERTRGDRPLVPEYIRFAKRLSEERPSAGAEAAQRSFLNPNLEGHGRQVARVV